MALTMADLTRGYHRPEWEGYGYLGERRHLNAAERRAADEALLNEARRSGWSVRELFDFTNSRAGRHYAAAATYTTNVAELQGRLAAQYIPWFYRERPTPLHVSMEGGPTQGGRVLAGGPWRRKPARKLLGRTGSRAARRAGRR